MNKLFGFSPDRVSNSVRAFSSIKIPILIFIIAFLSSCVSLKKHRRMLVEKEYELALEKQHLAIEREKAHQAAQIALQVNQRCEKALEKAITDVVRLESEVKALEKDSSEVAKLIVKKRRLETDNQKLEEAVTKLKEVESKFFPFESFSGRVDLFNNTFDFYIVDLRKKKIDIFWKGKNKKPILSLAALRQQTETGRNKLEMATNGGMFLDGFVPQGLFVKNGKQLRPIDKTETAYGNFYMQPNGIFLIDKKGKAHVISTDDYPKYAKQTQLATQSGPALVLNNIIHHRFREGSTNKYVRSGVGVISPYRVVFAISNQPTNFFDFATLFRDYFGCADALYLDGAISKMYLPLLNRNELSGNFGTMIGVYDK